MMPRGFKPVGWVAAVGGAALSCYMLSLNVAAERAEVTKLERQIVLAKQDIRSLQTELGTRGRLSQLEHWNADVLALSAPTNAQFLDDAVTLARFDRHDGTVEEKIKVQMASAEIAGPAPRVEAQPEAAPARKLPPVQFAVATQRDALQPQQPLLRQASYTPGEAKVVAAVARTEAKPVVVKAAARTEPRPPAKPEAKKVEAKAKASTAKTLKTVVADLGEDKPVAASGGAKGKAEAGLR